MKREEQGIVSRDQPDSDSSTLTLKMLRKSARDVMWSITRMTGYVLMKKSLEKSAQIQDQFSPRIQGQIFSKLSPKVVHSLYCGLLFVDTRRL